MVSSQRLVLLGCALCLFTACARQDDGGSGASTGSSAAGGRAPAEQTESSLAIKRGTVTQPASGRLVMQLCGSDDELPLEDLSGGLLAELMQSGDLGEALYIEAYGERETAGAAGAVFVLEQLLYAGHPGEIGGCQRPPPDYIVMARGNEPFWALTVEDAQMRWHQPEPPEELVFASYQSQPAEGSVQYLAEADGHALELLVSEQACRDSMSGEFFAFTARAVLEGRDFTGCARVGQ